MEDNLGAIVCHRFSQLSQDRHNWDNHWEEIARFVIPRKNNVYGNYDPGAKKNQHLFNSEAIKCNDELADALASIMTNPQTKWMELGDVNQVDVPEDEAKWLDTATELMLRTLAKSNFYVALHEVYTDLPSLSTGAFFTHEDDEEVVWFESNPIYEWFLGLDNKKRVRVAYRKYQYSLRQIVMEFGKDVLKDETFKQQYDANPDKKMDIIHAIEPMDTIKNYYKKKPSNAMKFCSVHVLSQSKMVLRESGFRTFPAAFPRFSVSGDEVYGRGPAMKSLPDIKTLNAMEGVNLQSAQLTMAPPLQTTENALLRPVSYKPFGMTFRKPGSDEIKPLVTGARVDIGVDLISRKEEKIKEHFYIPQLRMIENDRMTATEIMQRRDEQFRSLGSVLSRLSKELLEPVIDRVFDIMFRKKLFPEVPDSLKSAGGQLKVSYTSLIARAQAAAEAENFTRAVQATGPILEFQPEVMDNIDGDLVLRHNMEKMGVNRNFLRSKAAVKQLRDQRAQAQEQAQNAQQAEMESGAIKNLSEAEANGQ